MPPNEPHLRLRRELGAFRRGGCAVSRSQVIASHQELRGLNLSPSADYTIYRHAVAEALAVYEKACFDAKADLVKQQNACPHAQTNPFMPWFNNDQWEECGNCRARRQVGGTVWLDIDNHELTGGAK